ncbi:MAG: hypothetical protein ABEJ55_05245 [Halanaeroarchaeum sp.]
MKFRNRDGTVVDPTPWLVVVSLGFMLLFSIGPIYLQEYGMALVPALITLSLAFLGLVAVAYWRYVHTVRPDLREEVPPDVRLERLLYGTLAGILFLLAVSLPLATRYR